MVGGLEGAYLLDDTFVGLDGIFLFRFDLLLFIFIVALFFKLDERGWIWVGGYIGY